MQLTGELISEHKNTQGELITLERVKPGNPKFAGQLLLVIHDNGHTETAAPMLFDRSTAVWLKEAIDRVEREDRERSINEYRERISRMKVFTTGQVAEICKVAPRTVAKWFDSGRLKGYRIPGTQDRRIPREYLFKFLREHGMSDKIADLEREESDGERCLTD